MAHVPLSIQYLPEVSLGQALAYKLTEFTGNVNTLLSPAETWRDGRGAMGERNRSKLRYDNYYKHAYMHNPAIYVKQIKRIYIRTH